MQMLEMGSLRELQTSPVSVGACAHPLKRPLLPLSLRELCCRWVLGTAGVLPTAVGMILRPSNGLFLGSGPGWGSEVSPLVTSSPCGSALSG